MAIKIIEELDEKPHCTAEISTMAGKAIALCPNPPTNSRQAEEAVSCFEGR